MLERIWNNIINHEGEEFETATGLVFTYIIENEKVIPIREGERKWPLSKHVFEKALQFTTYSGSEFSNKIIGSAYVRGLLEDRRIK